MRKITVFLSILSCSPVVLAEISRESDLKNRWESITYEGSDLQNHLGVIRENSLIFEFDPRDEDQKRKKNGVFNYICARNVQPNIKPESEWIWSGPKEDFYGKGKLRIYLDFKAKTVFEPSIFDKTREAYKSDLLVFEISGSNFEKKEKKFAYKNFECTPRTYEFLKPMIETPRIGFSTIDVPFQDNVNIIAGVCSVETEFDRSFLEIETTDPKDVEFRLKANRYLVGLELRKIQFFWSRQ